jgi:hypothetical protein
MDSGTRFRASACGKYIVVAIGAASPHVLTLEEAAAVLIEYGAAAGRAPTAAARAYEEASANAIRLAIAEARSR